MGDCADLVLDGYLNQMGEYTGYDNSDWGYSENKNIKYINRVRNLLKSIGNKWKWKYMYFIIMRYGKEELFTDKSCTRICIMICSGEDKTEYNKFKKWVRTNYPKPCETK